MICDQSQQLHIKFKKAENAYQPKIDPNTMKFEDINDDCMLYIASYLNLIDIANLAKSSSRLFETVRRFYRKKLNFSYRPMKQTDMQSILEVIGPNFESINWYGLRRNHLNCLSQYCPNVTELKLEHRSNELSTTHIVSNKNFFEKIETLDICDARFFDKDLETIASSSALKSLQLRSCFGLNGIFLSKWKYCKLKFLKIRNCSGVNNDAVFDFVRKSKLVKFSFGENSSFHQFLSLPPKCLSDLEEVELCYANFTDDELKLLNFRDLKRLNHFCLESKGVFQNCNKLLVALSQIPTLTSLTIESMVFDDDTLNCLGLLKNLRTFRARNCLNRVRGRISSVDVFLPDDNDGSKTICDLVSSLSAFANAF